MTTTTTTTNNNNNNKSTNNNSVVASSSTATEEEEEVNIIVVAVCGLPGAGKSRLCQQLQKELPLLQHRCGSSTTVDEKDNNYNGDSNNVDDANSGKNASPSTCCCCCHVIEYDAVQERHAVLAEEEVSRTDVGVNEQQQDDLVDLELDAWRKTRVTALQELETLLQQHVQQHQQQDRDNNNNNNNRKKPQQPQSTVLPRTTTTRPTSSIIILDDNFHLRSMRKRIYQVCQKSVAGVTDNNNVRHKTNVYFAVIWIQTPIELCLERNRLRPKVERRQVPDTIIHKMLTTAELPNSTLYHWERINLIVSLDDDNKDKDDEGDDGDDDIILLKKVQKFLLGIPNNKKYQHVVPDATEQDVMEEERRVRQERQKTLKSKKHQIDRILRQCVQSVAQIQPKSGTRANQIRQRLLKKIHIEDEVQVSNTQEEELKQLFVNEFFFMTTSEEDIWTNDDKERLYQQLQVQKEGGC